MSGFSPYFLLLKYYEVQDYLVKEFGHNLGLALSCKALWEQYQQKKKYMVIHLPVCSAAYR